MSDEQFPPSTPRVLDAFEDLDLAYSAQGTITPAQFADLMDRYRRASDEAVRGLAGTQGVAYDETPEHLDVWGATPGERRPAVVAIHGGYWRMLARQDTAFMARALAAHGVATVTVDYTLSPHAPLEQIVRQVRAAVAWVWLHGGEYGLDRDRIVLVGSSAGAHLAAMAAVAGWQAAHAIPEDVVNGALLLSGLYDLRPLLRAFPNDWLALDEARARACSPLLSPAPPGQVVVATAELEAAGFHAQSAAYAAHTGAEVVVEPGRNHFDVFLDLADPGSRLFGALLDLVEGTAA